MTSMVRQGLGRIKGVIFSSSGLPLFLTVTILALLFVIFRMKGIELSYKISTLDKQLKEVEIKNRDLRAQKAKLLSIKELRKLANKYNLKNPDQKHIIVIP